MELAIVSLIAAAGYALSGPGKRPRERPEHARVPAHPSQFPFAPTVDTARIDGEFRAAAGARYEQALNPEQSGIIGTREMVPFFSSESKQNTNTNVKQTRLETFTGATEYGASSTGTWQPKQVAAPLFSPQERRVEVGFSGSMGNPQLPIGERREETYIVGDIQNNVRPMAQIQVGPGVGAAPTTPASGGFHYGTVRVMPDANRDLGAYKKNVLPGRTNHAASQVPTRASDIPCVPKNSKGLRFYGDCQRERMPSSYMPWGPTERAEATREPAFDLTAGPRDGISTGLAPAGVAKPHASRMRGDSTGAFPLVNSTPTTAMAPGGYTNATLESQRRHIRETGTRAAQANSASVTAPRAPGGMLVPITQRGAEARQVAAGTLPTGGTVHFQEGPRRTLRDAHLYAAPHGNSKAPIGATTFDNATRLVNVARCNGNRVVVEPAFKPAGRQNITGRLDHVSLRSDSHLAPAAGAADRLVAPARAAPIGELTSTYNKLPVENTRLDLGIACAQLANNPLAVTHFAR